MNVASMNPTGCPGRALLIAGNAPTAKAAAGAPLSLSKIRSGRMGDTIQHGTGGYYPTPAPFDAASALEQTETFWTEWCRKGRDAGPLSETVRRSLITLKALTYAPTGGTVQAMYGITGERRLMEWIVPGQDP
jgi:hypothetical protein